MQQVSFERERTRFLLPLTILKWKCSFIQQKATNNGREQLYEMKKETGVSSFLKKKYWERQSFKAENSEEQKKEKDSVI